MTRKKTIIIAEAGVNHNGSIENAIKLIDEASRCGADIVKFQHTNPDLISPSAKKAKYQKQNSRKNETQKEMISKFHLDWNKSYKLLIERCKKRKIKFLTSAFSVQDYLLVKNLNLNFVKIPSGEIVNIELLEKISRSKKKILLSTGMATIQEIKNAFKILTKNCKKKQITLLHCVSEYPTPFHHVNLLSINYLRNFFKVDIGISDHSLGIEVPIAATALGAVVIEKHFTLSKKMPGPDHKASLEPKEFSEMVEKIRNIELSLGSLTKKPNDIEIKTSYLVRQSVHASKHIEAGERFTAENICLMRPNDGMSSKNLKKLYNKISKKNIFKYDPIKKDYFK